MNPVSSGRVLWGAGTSRTLRAHWMLRELNLPYESRPIASRSAETATEDYIRLNPSQKIPTLVDGDFVLSESAAIVTYLGAAYGAAKNLAPPMQTRERARYDQWCFFAMMELDANTLYIIRRHEDLKAIYGEASNAVQAARDCFARQARAAAERLSATGPFVLGDRFTGADILVTTCLNGALRRQIEIPHALHDYVKRTTARDAYREALEANKARG
jgi:glutathione S-transferase